MRRLAIAALALAALAGCQSITRSTDAGTRTRHDLRQEPHRAAVCIARNIDAHPTKLDARIREGKQPALIEVRISAQELVALAELLVRGDGRQSTALIWTSPTLAPPRDALVAAMLSGC